MGQVVVLEIAIGNHLIICPFFHTGYIVEDYLATDASEFKLDFLGVE